MRVFGLFRAQIGQAGEHAPFFARTFVVDAGNHFQRLGGQQAVVARQFAFRVTHGTEQLPAFRYERHYFVQIQTACQLDTADSGLVDVLHLPIQFFGVGVAAQTVVIIHLGAAGFAAGGQFLLFRQEIAVVALIQVGIQRTFFAASLQGEGVGGAALGFQVRIGQPITRTVVVGEIHFGRIGDAVAGSDVVTDTPSLIQLRRQAGETAPAAVSIGCGRCFVAGMTVGIQLLRRHFGVVVTDARAA